MVRTLPRQTYDHETGEDFDVIGDDHMPPYPSEDPRRKPTSWWPRRRGSLSRGQRRRSFKVGGGQDPEIQVAQYSCDC